MAMSNAKSIKTTLDIFFKENGRTPDFNEFRKLLLGQSLKEKAAPKPHETEQNQESEKSPQA